MPPSLLVLEGRRAVVVGEGARVLPSEYVCMYVCIYVCMYVRR